jgi:hypothetical protein
MTTPPAILLARTGPALSQAHASTLSSSSSNSFHSPRVQTPSAQPMAPSIPPLQLHPTFLPGTDHAGTVLILVEDYEFFVHRDILIFASSFFESLLSGDWRETHMSETSTLAEHELQADAASPVPRPIRSGSVDRSLSNLALSEPQMDEHRTSMISDDSFLSTHTSMDSPIDLPPEVPLPYSELHSGQTSRSMTPLARTSHLQPRDDRLAFANRLAQSHDTWTIASSHTSFAQQVEEAGVEYEQGNDIEGTALLPQRKLDARIRLREERAAPFMDLCKPTLIFESHG